MNQSKFALLVVAFLLALVATACNLSSSPEERIDITTIPTNTISGQPTRTNVGAPTSVAITSLPPLTSLPPTAVVIMPSSQPLATSTPSTASIFIVSPIPGSIVAGNVQILGSATHPNFLQYQLEFGPDPNPGNLWYPIGGARLSPVLNNLLGIWSTTAGNVPDGTYQLRLRVFLRDGSNPQTVVNNIRVQNQVPTPQPSPTQSIPRPIAAFSYTPKVGLAPLAVTFTNQSSGNITSYTWDFGNGSTSNERNPVHTFRQPGTYDVKLTVVGPGGSSNVASRVQVNAGDPPVARFVEDRISGTAPLTVHFTNQSTGNIRRYIWDFGDGTTTNEQSPQHTFTSQGTYNVILEVRGPAGSSQTVHTITVINPTVQPPVARFTPTNQTIELGQGIQFTNGSSGSITHYLWEFGDGTISTDPNPRKLYNAPGTYNVKFTVIGEGGQNSTTGTIVVNRPPRAPIAKFSANPTNGNAPLTVQFTNESDGDVTGYSWNFGGAGTSTETHPTFRFDTPGTYTVTLIATGQNNTSSTATMNISVTQPLKAPQAAFVANPTTGNAPLVVQFTNQSSGDQLTYRWDFGDGTTSDTAEALVNHTYQTNGTYNVTLTVSGPGGDPSTATATITVTNALSAAFDAFPLENTLQYKFTDQSTGNPTAWQWDFGDGAKSNEQSPQHEFAAGTYTVTLTVTNAGGNSTAQRQITVTRPLVAPQASFTASTTAGNTPLTVEFTNNSTGDIASYLWQFSDGFTSTDRELQPYTFTVAGTYTVTLTLTGQDNSTSTDTETIVVSAGPQANFQAAPDLTNPRRIQFTSTSTGEVWGYYWQFGDGNESQEQNPLHTYAQGGNYDVTLTVYGPNDSEDSITQPVSVQQPVEPPVAAFTADRTTINQNEAVTFTNTSTGDITTYVWNFGDGTTSNERDPGPHTFTTIGDNIVTLTVSGPGGPDSTATTTITVQQVFQPPVAAFTANPTTVVVGEPVTFTNSSTGDITGYTWNFGDGANSDQRDPAPYAYTIAGTYPVTLTVSGPGGDPTTAQATIVVNPPAVPAPVANFDFTFPDLARPQDVQFNNTSTGEITAYAWNFGDEVGTSAEQSPLYTYEASNSYPVTLTVTGPGGSNSITQQVPVTIPDAPTPTFTPDPGDGSIANTTAVEPNIDAFAGRFAEILANAPANGNPPMRTDVFSVVGDGSANANFLLPFAALDTYSLGGNIEGEISDTITLYNGGEVNSFARLGETPRGSAEELLAESSACPGFSHLACELQISTPAVLIISVGYKEARDMNPDAIDFEPFRANLRQMVQTSIDNGTIPVLLTVYRRPSDQIAKYRAVNEVIIEVANEFDVPVVNVWRLFRELADQAYSGDEPSIAPNDNGQPFPGLLRRPEIDTFGENARNYYALRTLDRILEVLPQP